MHEQALDVVKIFGMTNQLLADELTRIERRYDVRLQHVQREEEKEADEYYAQFTAVLRKEAAEMSRHYRVFYCLEKSIRSLISELLEDEEGTDWWNSSRVPPNLQQEVRKRIKRESETGMTLRSTDPLDFTNFGELSVVICANWDVFGGVLRSQKAVERVLSNLNSLRGPIAHCSPLAEDEVLRLHLGLRDWFRQME